MTSQQEPSAPDEAPSDPAVVCRVHRAGLTWIAAADDPQIHTHGRTLREIEQGARDAATLALNAPAERVAVSLEPTSPELIALIAARYTYEAACAEAVRRLRAQRVAWSEVARVTGLTQLQARRIASQPAPTPSSSQIPEHSEPAPTRSQPSSS